MGSVDPQAASDFLKRTYQRECRDRTQAERNHYASVCRDYLVKSFEARISRAQERAMSIGAMTARNPDYKLAFDEAFKVVADLKRDKEDRLAGLERLALARPGPVRYIGTAIVLTPDATVEAQLGAFALETDSELRRRKEKKAEDLTIASLIAEGFPAQNIERIGNEEARIRHPSPSSHRPRDRRHRGPPDRGQRLHQRKRDPDDPERVVQGPAAWRDVLALCCVGSPDS